MLGSIFGFQNLIYLDIFSGFKCFWDGQDIKVFLINIKGEIEMPQSQINVEQLNQAKASVTLTQNLLSQAIDKATSDPTLAEEAIKQAANEIAQAQTAVSQVQSGLMVQKSDI